MLHLFMDKGPWFRVNKLGYGAGLPFKWQGWALVASHIGMIAGLAVAFMDRPMLLFLPVLLAAFAPMPIYASRTEGG